MASWKDLYHGNGFLTLALLGKRSVTGVINSCEPVTREIKSKEQTKLEITIDGIEQAVILNQDSCKSLAKAYGDDYDEWIGKRVKVAKGRVAFGKGTVDAICVTPVKGANK